MSGAPELLRHARAARRRRCRTGYRAAGCWSPQPADVVRVTAARASHPAGVSRQDGRADLRRPRRTDRPGLPGDGRGRGGGVDADRPGRRQRCGLGGGRARRAASRRGGAVGAPQRGADPGGRHPRPHRCRIRRRHRTGRLSARPSCRDCAPGSGSATPSPAKSHVISRSVRPTHRPSCCTPRAPRPGRRASSTP